MEILLLILKIAGLLAGGILGIICLLILAVIAIPVRYRISGRAEDLKTMEGCLILSFFLRLIHVKLQYAQGTSSIVIRILGIPFTPGRKKTAKFKKNKKDRKQKKEKSQNTKRNSECEFNPKDLSQENEMQMESHEQSTLEDISTRLDISEKSAQSDTEKTRKIRTPKRRIRNLITEILELYKKLKEFIKQLKNGTITVRGQIERLKNILSQETNKNAFLLFLKEFQYLLRHFSPRKAQGQLVFSMGDPALTGQTLGMVSIFPFWHRYKISVEPDFLSEELYIKGCLYAFGHMRTIHLLISGIRLIKDKNIRSLINQIRN